MSSLILRNVRVNGRRTSVRLEPEMWDALHEICDFERSNMDQICARAAKEDFERGFTSSLRVFIVNYFRGRDAPTIGIVSSRARRQRTNDRRSGRVAKETMVDINTIPATSWGARSKRWAKR